MKLIDKFEKWLDTNPNRRLRNIQCEVIADEFAIGFANWVNENAYKYPSNTTTAELLEIYKKEKGL